MGSGIRVLLRDGIEGGYINGYISNEIISSNVDSFFRDFEIVRVYFNVLRTKELGEHVQKMGKILFD